MNTVTAGLLATIMLLACPAMAEEVYKRIDESGVPSFSDTKSKDAEKIIVEPINVQDIPAPPSLLPLTSHQNETAPTYNQLSISSPTDQTTFRNEASINVQLSVKPALKKGHQIELLDNGAPLQVGEKTSFVLNDFDRGSHALSARIIDKKGKTLISSQPVTIFVFRNIIKTDNNPAP